jgi:hypothetical protein
VKRKEMKGRNAKRFEVQEREMPNEISSATAFCSMIFPRKLPSARALAEGKNQEEAERHHLLNDNARDCDFARNYFQGIKEYIKIQKQDKIQSS